jgi:hypothetical protein
VSFANAADYGGGRPGDLQVSLSLAGNYDARWLPKVAAIKSNSSYESFSTVSYRAKAELTDMEVGLLKKLHEAGWTAYTRLNAAGTEDPRSRTLEMLQGGSHLTVSIGYPADSNDELYVQTSTRVINKSVPIPPDAGWIEFDDSNDLQCVINTKMNFEQTTQFYDQQMAAAGWLAREARRQPKEDRAWLPYIRGQQDLTVGLLAMPNGGTRIVVGQAYGSSWQLQKPDARSEKPAETPAEKPGIEAADFALPSEAKEVKFDVDQKRIDFAAPGSTPAKLGDAFVKQMESLKWQRDGAGVLSDEYVFITFKQGRAEIQLRARSQNKKTTAMISGDGLMWEKPLPTAPVRISYETWLRRNRRDASLDLLDEFAAEMHKIPASKGQQ